VELTINLDDLTIGDMADIEDATGVALAGINLKQPPMRLIPALVWVQERRRDPGYTYEMARAMARAIKLTELVVVGAAPTSAVAGGDGGAASGATSS